MCFSEKHSSFIFWEPELDSTTKQKRHYPSLLQWYFVISQWSIDSTHSSSSTHPLLCFSELIFLTTHSNNFIKSLKILSLVSKFERRIRDTISNYYFDCFWHQTAIPCEISSEVTSEVDKVYNNQNLNEYAVIGTVYIAIWVTGVLKRFLTNISLWLVKCNLSEKVVELEDVLEHASIEELKEALPDSSPRYLSTLLSI